MNKALSCGCVVDIELTGYGNIWSEVDIDYCPKHAAAQPQQERIAAPQEQAVDQQHLKVLEEIQDLASTSMPDKGYGIGEWDRHRLNWIANMAAKAIEENKNG